MYLRYKNILTGTLALLFLIMANTSFAAPEKTVAKVDEASGYVTVTRSTGEVVRLKAGDTLNEGDVINTGNESSVSIKFFNGELVTLGSLASYTLGNVDGGTPYANRGSGSNNSPTLSTATSAGGGINEPDAPTTPDAGGSPTN